MSDGQLRARLDRWLRAAGFDRDWLLIPMAAIVGTLGGLVALGFDWLVHLSKHSLFETIAEMGERGTKWIIVLFLPALGGLVVGIIQEFISRQGPSHGVPEVVKALAKDQGRMPASMGYFKAFTAAGTLGSGGSAGVEGPIIQIGSVLGSQVGQLLRVGREHMSTLVGCGAAAGTAAIFNAPIAGVLFVLEVMLRDFSFRTFTPIVIASVFGTAISQTFHADNTAVFSLPAALLELDHRFLFQEMPAYIALGILCGLLGVGFAVMMRHGERWWQHAPGPRFLRPAAGGLMLGVLGVIFVYAFSYPMQGHLAPLFFGNGYPVIESLLNPESYQDMTDQTASGPIMQAAWWLLFITLAFKILGTMLTICSGGSGGIIAPSLFLGATLGGGFALMLDGFGLLPGTTPATYALAGMAGTIAAVIHAPLTATLLVFEITRDYAVILPMMTVAILSLVVSQLMVPDSIYTAWLRSRGINLGTRSDMTLLRHLTVADVPLLPCVSIYPADPAERLIGLTGEHHASDFVVRSAEGGYAGMVVGEDLRMSLVEREAIPLMVVAELMRNDLPTVRPEESLDAVMDKFSDHDVASLAVLEGDKVTGMITRSRLMRTYHRALAERG
ncbi:chloride channel protein [Mucisphaera calidilacus]|uniref:H(+)/Cl(-) exchange transporter ClcA n=1 Tax=Mucisphaera calidilacus TaxID=2527982 RepID=A0A518BZR5_9BACT|nr:chloride channel protein [Mucisphaera calidilacus]QDU72462.1 H(+)/Cl(-) exchange transporter ClcA [Mucisphaera calidilacus]